MNTLQAIILGCYVAGAFIGWAIVRGGNRNG